MASALPLTEVSSAPPSANYGGNGFTYLEEEEEAQSSPSNAQKAAAELIGTFVLVFVGCASAFVNLQFNLTPAGVALAWGSALATMIYTLGHISGGHFNPAVTIAFAMAGHFPWRHVPFYVVVQVLGSVLASFSLRWLFDQDQADVMLTLPGASWNDVRVVAMEIFTSFILMWVICGTSDHRASKDLSGVAIGASIVFDVLIAGKFSGASMNPARSMGPAIATQNFRKIWIYIVAPIAGTTCSSALYNLLRLPEKCFALKPKTIVAPEINSQIDQVFSEKSMVLP